MPTDLRADDADPILPDVLYPRGVLTSIAQRVGLILDPDSCHQPAQGVGTLPR